MRQAVRDYDIEFDVYRYEPNPDAPFQIVSETGINVYNKAEVYRIDVEQYQGCYCAGWADKDYLKIAQTLKQNNKSVIVGMDNHWKGNLKQKIASFLGKVYLKKYFTHIWIPGLYQFPFAQRLGFSNDRILKGLYVADHDSFDLGKADSLNNSFNKRFVFIGRLVGHKGVNNLIKAFQSVCDQLPDWKLEIIGNGELKNSIPSHPQFVHHAFIDPTELPKFLKQGGVFVLPSTYEAWGVVLHEAVCAGMPVISTYETGATTAFLEDGHNGFIYNSSSINDLASIFLKIAQGSESKLLTMSKNSLELSNRITKVHWANSLYNTFKS